MTAVGCRGAPLAMPCTPSVNVCFVNRCVTRVDLAEGLISVSRLVAAAGSVQLDKVDGAASKAVDGVSGSAGGAASTPVVVVAPASTSSTSNGVAHPEWAAIVEARSATVKKTVESLLTELQVWRENHRGRCCLLWSPPQRCCRERYSRRGAAPSG